MVFELKRFLLNWIEFFSEGGQKFCQIYEMNIATISNEVNMTHECQNKQPIQIVEMNLNMII